MDSLKHLFSLPIKISHAQVETIYKEITSFVIPVNTVKTNNFTILYPCSSRFRFLHVGLLVSLPNKNTSLVTTKEKKVAGGMLRSPQSTLTIHCDELKNLGLQKDCQLQEMQLIPQICFLNIRNMFIHALGILVHICSHAEHGHGN